MTSFVDSGCLDSQVCSRLFEMMPTGLVLDEDILNHPVAGSIIVNVHNCRVWLLGCLNLYRLMQYIHNVSHGIVLASLASRWACLFFFLLVS